MNVALQQMRDRDSEKNQQAKHYAYTLLEMLYCLREREKTSCLPRMRVNLMKWPPVMRTKSA